MKVIGITGGIGSGKSEICRYLKDKYEAEIIMADDVGHEVTEPGTDCNGKLRKTLGDEFFLQDGTMDRKQVGAAVFSNPELLEKINSIIHPAVMDEIVKRLGAAKQSGKRLAVIEAALLVGSPYRQLCDEFWYIYADRDVRLKRLAEGRDMDESRALAVMDNQLSDEEFEKGCDFTADNSRDFDYTVRQIDKRIAGLGAA